ncbi:MAG TPA: TetR/AcrR family transcriptional regulator [Ktedonobacterales bacterium]
MTAPTRSAARDRPERDDTRSKRDAIIAAARTLFAKQGYEETTIAEIARAAGVGVGTVYLYFENKRQILVEVSVSVTVDLAEIMGSPELLTLPIQQVPRLLIEAAFRKCHDNLAVMSLFDVNVPSPEEVSQIQVAHDRIAQALDGFFRQAIERQILPPFDTIMYARMLTALVNAVLQQCFAVEHGVHEDLYRERLIELVERLFFGPPLQPAANPAREDKPTSA